MRQIEWRGCIAPQNDTPADFGKALEEILFRLIGLRNGKQLSKQVLRLLSKQNSRKLRPGIPLQNASDSRIAQ